jgi:hypothetical protein
MKSVSYTSNNKLSCGCNAAVIVCLDDALTAANAPFIEGTLAFSDSVINSCGRTTYRYAVTYDEGQLLDPEYSLLEADVTGVVCRGCLTSYIDYVSGSEIDSNLIFPTGLPPFPSDPPYVLAVLDVTGNVVTLGWYQPT